MAFAYRDKFFPCFFMRQIHRECFRSVPCLSSLLTLHILDAGRFGFLESNADIVPRMYEFAFTRNILLILVRGHSTTTWTEFCHFLTPPPCVDSFYTLSVDKNRHFLTPSPPHLVHVVIECPLISPFTYLRSLCLY